MAFINRDLDDMWLLLYDGAEVERSWEWTGYLKSTSCFSLKLLELSERAHLGNSRSTKQ